MVALVAELQHHTLVQATAQTLQTPDLFGVMARINKFQPSLGQSVARHEAPTQRTLSIVDQPGVGFGAGFLVCRCHSFLPAYPRP